MPTTITDASLTTARRRQLTLFGWRKLDQYPENPQTKKTEQAPSRGFKATGPTSDVPLNAYVGAQVAGQSGACACTSAVTLQGYVKSSPGC